MVVMGMKEAGLEPVKHLRSDFVDYDPCRPDSWEEFQWIPAAGADIVKPDGN